MVFNKFKKRFLVPFVFALGLNSNSTHAQENTDVYNYYFNNQTSQVEMISSKDIFSYGNNFVNSSKPDQVVNFEQRNGNRDGYYVYTLPNGKKTSVSFLKDGNNIILNKAEIEGLGRTLIDNKLIPEINLTHLENFKATDTKDIFNFSLKYSKTSKDFFNILSGIYKNAESEKKLEIIDKIYGMSASLYDDSVATGHSNEISVEEYFQGFIRGNNIGNCRDIACFNLTFGKEVLGIEGISLSILSHEMVVFQLENGKLYSPDSRGTKKLYSNFYELASDRDSIDPYSFISNCDELTSQVQSYFQKKFQREIMPSGIVSYKDLDKKIPEEEFGLSSPSIFMIGDDSKNVSGVSIDYLKKSKFKEVKGTFGISGTISNFSSNGGANVQLGVTGFSDFKVDLPNPIKNDLKTSCGLFTKMMGLKVLDGNRNSIGNFDIDSNLYCFVPFNDNLKLVGSIGTIYVENGQLINDEYQQYGYSEIGLKYKFKGVSVDVFNKSILKQNTTNVNLGYNLGDFKISADIIHTQYKDKVVEQIVPELQKELSLSYNNRVSLSLTQEGSEPKILLRSNIPFSIFY